jgi:hypothetical protein
MGIAVFKETTTGGYNIGIGYNPFTENITGQIILVLDTGRYSHSLGNNNTFIGDQTKQII